MSAAAAHRTDQWTLIFDGDCRFCRACVRLLQRRDRDRRLRFVPFQDAAALARLPPMERRALEQSMHLVSPAGVTWTGGAALSPVLRLLPAGQVLAPLLALPGAGALAGHAYRLVARHRHRLGCGSAVCPRGR